MRNTSLPVGPCRPYNAGGFLPLSGSVGEVQLMSSVGSVTHWLTQLQASDAAAASLLTWVTAQRSIPAVGKKAGAGQNHQAMQTMTGAAAASAPIAALARRAHDGNTRAGTAATPLGRNA